MPDRTIFIAAGLLLLAAATGVFWFMGDDTDASPGPDTGETQPDDAEEGDDGVDITVPRAVFEPVPRTELPNGTRWISTCQELQAINERKNGVFALEEDIDCRVTQYWHDGSGFKPVDFRGELYGQGHTVVGLTVNRTDKEGVGLFGSIGGVATVRNLGLYDVSITGTVRTGGLAGQNQGVVSRTYVVGDVDGSRRVGTLVGRNGGVINDSYAEGSASGFRSVAGLAGQNFGGIIRRSYADVGVNGSERVGGLAGHNYNGEVHRSFSTGTVAGVRYVGGLVGQHAFRSLIEETYTVSEVDGNESTGALVGAVQGGDVERSFWSTDIAPQGGAGTGRSTSQLHDRSTYTRADWDVEETWYMDAYPRLQWER